MRRFAKAVAADLGVYGGAGGWLYQGTEVVCQGYDLFWRLLVRRLIIVRAEDDAAVRDTFGRGWKVDSDVVTTYLADRFERRSEWFPPPAN